VLDLANNQLESGWSRQNGPNEWIKGASKEQNGHMMSRALQELL